MSITLSSVVFSPIVSGVTTAIVAVTVPAGTTALFIAGFADFTPTTVGNATVAQFNSVNMELVTKSMPGVAGRPIWVYKMVNPPVGTFNAVFNEGTSTSRQLAAWTVQSTNSLIIDGNAGNVGNNTTPSSTILSSYVSGKVVSILSANNLAPTDVTETGGQAIVGENTYSAGFLYAGVDVKTPSGPIGSATTAAWTLATAQEWGEISISIREVTKASSSTSDSSISGQLSTIITNIGTLSALVTTDYNATISAISTQTTGQNTRFTAIDNAITNVGSGVTSINGSLSSFITSTGTSFSTVSTQVGGVSTQVTAAKAVIDTINTNVNTINSTTTSTYNNVNTVASELGSARTNINTANANINTLQTTANGIGTSVTTTSGKVDGVRTVVDGIATNVVGARSDISNIGTDIANFRTNTTTRFNTVDSSLTTIYNKIAFVGDGQVQDVYDFVAEVSTDLATVRTALAASDAINGVSLKDWMIGETKYLERGANLNIAAANFGIFSRYIPRFVNSDNSSKAYEMAQQAMNFSFANLSAYGHSSEPIGMRGANRGPNGTTVAVGSTNATTSYIVRGTNEIDLNTVLSINAILGTPVTNGSGYWVCPSINSQIVYWSGDDGITWNLATTGGNYFTVTPFMQNGHIGDSPIWWDGFWFLTIQQGSSTDASVRRSSDGITWTSGADITNFRAMGIFCTNALSGASAVYGWNSTTKRCMFYTSVNGFNTWASGAVFNNNGVDVASITEAQQHNVVHSSDSSTILFYKSGRVYPSSSGEQILMEALAHAGAGAGYNPVLITAPKREQHITFHAGNCASVDADAFPHAFEKVIFRSSMPLVNIYRYANSITSYGSTFATFILARNVGALIAHLWPNSPKNAFKIRAMPNDPKQSCAGVLINPAFSGLLMWCDGESSVHGSAVGSYGIVLPPLIEYGIGTKMPFTRYY